MNFRCRGRAGKSLNSQNQGKAFERIQLPITKTNKQQNVVYRFKLSEIWSETSKFHFSNWKWSIMTDSYKWTSKESWATPNSAQAQIVLEHRLGCQLVYSLFVTTRRSINLQSVSLAQQMNHRKAAWVFKSLVIIYLFLGNAFLKPSHDPKSWGTQKILATEGKKLSVFIHCLFWKDLVQNADKYKERFPLT